MEEETSKEANAGKSNIEVLNYTVEESNDVLLFGKDLEKQVIDGAIDFSSDQESTGGEEDDQPLGNVINKSSPPNVQESICFI